MRYVWRWLKKEANTKALNAIIVGVPAASAALTYVYSTLWPVPDENIVIEAANLWKMDGVNVDSGGVDACRKGLVYNAPPYGPTKLNAAEYRVKLSAGGRYRLYIEYAADDPRPVEIAINDKPSFKNVLTTLTGSWCNNRTRWEDIGEVELSRGANTIRISRQNVFPHLKTLKLVRL